MLSLVVEACKLWAGMGRYSGGCENASPECGTRPVLEPSPCYFRSVGGTCGGLFFWSSRQSPQGNGLPCLGHLVALISVHLGVPIGVAELTEPCADAGCKAFGRGWHKRI